jgi:hypothetical protein
MKRLPLFLLPFVPLQAPSRQDPAALVRQVQEAFDRNGGHRVEREWRQALRARPNDPIAQLAVATIDRNQYRYERADTLYDLISKQRGPDSLAWRVVSRTGRAAWRALGSDVATADTLLSQAREDARRARRRDLEAESVIGLAQIRARTRGAAEGRQLVDTWWNLLDGKSPQGSAIFVPGRCAG